MGCQVRNIRTAWSYDLGCRAYMVLKCAVEGLGTVLPTSVQQSNTSPCGMATSSDALAMEFGGNRYNSTLGVLLLHNRVRGILQFTYIEESKGILLAMFVKYSAPHYLGSMRGFPKIGDPNLSYPNCRILIIRTPKYGTPNSWKLP